MRTRYKIDTYQATYFVIDIFEQLFEATAPDFTPIYAAWPAPAKWKPAACWHPIACTDARRSRGWPTAPQPRGRLAGSASLRQTSLNTSG